MNYPATDPEAIAQAINSEIAGALGLEPQNLPDEIVCSADWFATNTLGEVYPAIASAAELRLETLEWLTGCADYCEDDAAESAALAREKLQPARYALVTAAHMPERLPAPENAIAWHYATDEGPAGWIYDEATLAEYRAADPSLIVTITEEAEP